MCVLLIMATKRAKNVWKISTKLYAGFMLITLILAFVGLLGYQSITTLSSKTEVISRSATLVDAAMEMKVADSRDMQMIMELLASENQQDLDGVLARAQKNC